MASNPVKFTLEIEKGEHGLWYVTSPEIGGLLVAEERLGEIGMELTETIRELALAGNEKCQEIDRAMRRGNADG